MDNFIYKDLSIDFDSRLIFCKDTEFTLDPKAFNTLVYLIENKQRVVSSDELIEQIWDARPINNEVVTASIGRVRKVFKDAGIKSEVIRTAHKVGYQFILEESISGALPKSLGASAVGAKYIVRINLGLFFILLLGVAALAKKFTDFEVSKSAVTSAHTNVKDVQDTQSLSALKPTEIFFIRHAEKEPDGSDDPPLSEQGITRAKRWSTFFQNVTFDQIYTTHFIRNIKTVDYIFGENISNLNYYSALSFDVDVEVKKFAGKKVAIIGHSNTIPGMVNRLVSDQQYDAMDHRNYELIYQVVIDSSGGVSANQFTLDYILADK